MRTRTVIVVIASCIVGLVLTSTMAFVPPPMNPHPVCNRPKQGNKEHAWQIEYDIAHPRDGNYAVRLTIPPVENVAGGFGLVSITGTLYRFGSVDTSVSPPKYVVKTVANGGKVPLTGKIELAPERGTDTPKKHWSKKSMYLYLAGSYTAADASVKDVFVVGSLHPGNDNKKSQRGSYRLVLHIFERPHEALLLEKLEKLLETLKSENARDALARIRKLLLSDPCDEMPPADAAAEGDYTESMPADDFVYDQEHP